MFVLPWILNWCLPQQTTYKFAYLFIMQVSFPTVDFLSRRISQKVLIFSLNHDVVFVIAVTAFVVKKP